jgi:HAAS
MTTTTLHPLAADYLERLERAARRLPRGERRDLVEEISAHLSEATNPDMSDAEALTVLDRLGDPEDIVEAQEPDEPVGRRGTHEWATIFLLLLGGFLFVFGARPSAPRVQARSTRSSRSGFSASACLGRSSPRCTWRAAHVD